MATETALKNPPKNAQGGNPNAAPAATQSTKPGEPAPAAKKEKTKRVPYPGIKADDKGKGTVKLKDFPTDFDPKLHKQLTRKDFENDAPLLRKRAEELRVRASKLDKEAQDAETLGSASQRQAAKKLRGMVGRIGELTKDLEAQGIDVDAMFPGLKALAALPAK